jgi:hypothetical protein
VDRAPHGQAAPVGANAKCGLPGSVCVVELQQLPPAGELPDGSGAPPNGGELAPVGLKATP